MLNRVSIRSRLVIVTVIILTLCCAGLTLIINYSATQMATDVAQITIPAQSISTIEIPEELSPSYELNELYQYNDHEQIINTFYQHSILYMVFIIITGGFLMYHFSKRILLPIASLNEKIKSSTIDNFSDNISIPNTKDEIAELTISFNKMTDRIHDAFLFQQQFSANVAHELRTPLTILKTKIEVFHKKDQRTMLEHEQLISDLNDQVTRLSDIVKTLLELTNTDELQEKELISVSDLIDDILMEFSAISHEKSIQMITDIADVSVYGNVDMLYQVFYNLIQNSIKYNVEHGIVSICAKHEVDKTIIQFCDTGIGISPEYQKHIFEPFYRVDPSRSRAVGGAGLGLSIVKHIIEQHHGRIIIKNHIPQGTCFILELPNQE